MKFVRIHWQLVKKYVNFNTKKRQESTDEFSKELYKLLKNCIYGKSIENQRKIMNVELINDRRVYQKCVNKPNFIS